MSNKTMALLSAENCPRNFGILQDSHSPTTTPSDSQRTPSAGVDVLERAMVHVPRRVNRPSISTTPVQNHWRRLFMGPIDLFVYFYQANFTLEGVTFRLQIENLRRSPLDHEDFRAWYSGTVVEALLAEENCYFAGTSIFVVWAAEYANKARGAGCHNQVTVEFMRILIGTVLGSQVSADSARKTLNKYLACRGHPDKFQHFSSCSERGDSNAHLMNEILNNIRDILDDSSYHEAIFARPVTPPQWKSWYENYVELNALAVRERQRSASPRRSSKREQISSLNWRFSRLETAGKLGDAVFLALTQIPNPSCIRTWFTGTREEAYQSVNDSNAQTDPLNTERAEKARALSNLGEALRTLARHPTSNPVALQAIRAAMFHIMGPQLSPQQARETIAAFGARTSVPYMNRFRATPPWDPLSIAYGYPGVVAGLKRILENDTYCDYLFAEAQVSLPELASPRSFSDQAMQLVCAVYLIVFTWVRSFWY